ncbi:MAG TPA: hypothetical protein H9951_15400 [Candidatus Bacteroides intestinigallinarum]|nr:hypothetical protein [Candidatus Bacteroides intestinigallinarum]
MADCLLRNIDAAVMQKLKEDAKKKGLSCNKYIVGLLTNYVLASEVKELDSKYQELFKIVIDTIQGNSMLLHEVLMKLKEEKQEDDFKAVSSQ